MPCFLLEYCFVHRSQGEIELGKPGLDEFAADFIAHKPVVDTVLCGKSDFREALSADADYLSEAGHIAEQIIIFEVEEDGFSFRCIGK